MIRAKPREPGQDSLSDTLGSSGIVVHDRGRDEVRRPPHPRCADLLTQAAGYLQIILLLSIHIFISGA